jgi:hypothetical protein
METLIQIMNCQYCNKFLNTRISLQNHQKYKPPKSCLKIRVENKCEHCDYIFLYNETSIEREEHVNKNHRDILRKMFYTNMTKEFEDKYNTLLVEHNKVLEERSKLIKEHRQEVEMLKTELSLQYEPKMSALKSTVAVLEEQLQFERERTSTQFKILSEQKGNVNITNNNTINYFEGVDGHLNLTPEYIQSQVDANFTLKHMLGGEKGIALFCKDNLLTDGQKNLLYVACDVSRKKFKMKMDDGVKDDYKAYKLITSIHPPIMNKIHTDLCHPDKMDEVADDDQERWYDKMAECRKINEDSSKFCNYLSELTTS